MYKKKVGGKISNCKVCKAWQKSGRNQAKCRASRILMSCQQNHPNIFHMAYRSKLLSILTPSPLNIKKEKAI